MTHSISSKSLVLYADDDRDDIEMIEHAFSNYSKNVELIAFSDGLQLLSYLRELSAIDLHPCLIILDINMPLLDGKATLRTIRGMEQFTSTPVILFSTSSMPADMHYAKQYGAGYIIKPLELTMLERIVEKFIDHCSDEVKQKIKLI